MIGLIRHGSQGWGGKQMSLIVIGFRVSSVRSGTTKVSNTYQALLLLHRPLKHSTFYGVHVGRIVLPKWPIWAKACFRQVRVAHVRARQVHRAILALACTPKSRKKRRQININVLLWSGSCGPWDNQPVNRTKKLCVLLRNQEISFFFCLTDWLSRG